MASYRLNKAAVEKARQLIDGRQYVLNSDWGESQPTAADENQYLESHSWDDYAEWHLGLTEGAAEEGEDERGRWRRSGCSAFRTAFRI